MVVMSGYKQTEIGVIPDDWDITGLSCIASLVTGNTPPTNDKRNYGDQHLFVSPSDLGEHKWISSSEKKLSDRGRLFTRVVPKNSVMFVCIGSTIGKTGMAAVDLSTNQQINCAEVDLKHSPDFIYYALNLNAKRISFFAGQQAVPIINKTDFGKSLLAIPPARTEQEAIAGALSDADALIESLEQLIDKKRCLKQGAMQELLTGKRRLPGFEIKPGRKQTEVGAIPEDWTLKSIARIATTVASGRSSVDSEFGDFPVYGSTGMIGRSFQGDYAGRAILIARVGANAGTLNLVDGEYGVTDNAIIVRIGDSVFWCYVWWQLGAKRLNSMVFGSGQPLITGTQIKDVLIPFPPTKAEQEVIAAILNDLDSEIAALETKLAKARQLKQGMMQELLTGKTRLL